MSSRQEAQWGRVGQELILNSKILVTGLGPAGIETVKTAAMLGVGTIYLMDNETREGFFLDHKIDDSRNTAKQLENIVNELKFESGDTGRSVKVIAFEEDFINNTGLIEDIKPDAIFDFTNNPSSQSQALEYGIKLAETKPVEVFIGSCDNDFLVLNQYTPQEDDDIEIAEDNHITYDHAGKEQDLALSHLLSGMAIESFRKKLFLKNKELLKNAINYKGEQYIEVDVDFNPSLFYSVASRDSRDTGQPLDLTGIIAGKKFLLCGAGAIGNPMADLLVRYGAGRVDCIDFDRIEMHNIERQPFYCGRVGEYKADVLSEKIKNIAEKIGHKTESNSFLSKIGEKSILDYEGMEYFQEDWFRKNEYDAVFGCFDGSIPRATMNNYASTLKFNYIDGGSYPEGCDVTVFVPGKTACLNCTIRIHKLAAAQKKGIQSRAQNSCANPEITPNVCMSNRIAAGLMLIEAVRTLSTDYDPWSGTIEYNNQGPGIKTEPLDKSIRCDLCKNGYTGGKR